ncbi:MAG TPA: hypothetical protein VF746_00770 [Longimicrobium sp.]|jgi:peptidoglycan/LPS O-acetylase OafA/YrhL
MPEPTADERPTANAATLFIIRLSLLAGVAMFGAVTWFLYSRGRQPSAPDPVLDWVVIGVWAAVAVGLMLMSRRYRAAPRRTDRVTLAIIGWAFGEAAAMFGGVHYFITGNPLRYGYGLLIFCIALMLFPIPRDEDPRAHR